MLCPLGETRPGLAAEGEEVADDVAAAAGLAVHHLQDDRRVNILRITERIDAKNGQLAQLGFSPTEITTYVTRALNKRLRQLTGGDGACYVIRNQKLSVLQLEHKAA